MSHNCHTAIAKFVLHSAYCAGMKELDEDSNLEKLLQPEGFYEGEHSTEEEWEILKNQENIVLVSFGGWTHIKYKRSNEKETQITCIKKDKGILGDLWIKDNQKVWLINESPYSNGGDYMVSIVSNTKVEIKDFIKDHECLTKNKIEKDDVIESWY